MARLSWDREVSSDLNPARLRARHRRFLSHFTKPPREVAISPVTAEGVSAEWIEPPGAQFHRVLVYLHGGGYVLGGTNAYRTLVTRLATAASARALLIDYRLAPEHPFPAALEDALAVYRWLLLQGLDPAGIALAGDGSGAGLALATALALRDNRAPMPGAIAMMSPWLDLALSARTLLRNRDTDAIVSLELLAYCAQSYLQGALPTNPLASPLYANLSRLPPVLVHAGAAEILRDDSTRLGEKGDKFGLDVSVEVYASMPHVFQLFEKVPESEASLARLGSFIKSRTASVPLHIAAQ